VRNDCTRRDCKTKIHTLVCSTRMVFQKKAGETPVKPIAVWANQTQSSENSLGLDSTFLGGMTV